jgi:hypothetical protein
MVDRSCCACVALIRYCSAHQLSAIVHRCLATGHSSRTVAGEVVRVAGLSRDERVARDDLFESLMLCDRKC